jgi:hypothetical protein
VIGSPHGLIKKLPGNIAMQGGGFFQSGRSFQQTALRKLPVFFQNPQYVCSATTRKAQFDGNSTGIPGPLKP